MNTATPVSLPKPSPPGDTSFLDTLKLTVPAEPPVTQQQLVDCYMRMVSDHASRRPLAEGEPVGMHDEVRLDVLCYVGGALVPGTTRVGFETRLTPDVVAPGFAEALAGTQVGDRKDLELTLPADGEVPALRGVRATFRVTVRAGWEVEDPDPTSPDLLRRLGLGQTLQETFDALATWLRAGQRLQHRLQTRERALEALTEHLGERPRASAITQLLASEWERAEGLDLTRLRVPEAQREAARQAWLVDVRQRARAERQLRAHQAVTLVVERTGLRVTEAARREALEELAALRGQESEALQAERERDARVAEELEHITLYHVVADYVLARAQVRTSR